MPYHIAREGQTYGPYTIEDLQRYVASGNILLTDMAKADDTNDWVPVAQILNPGVPLGASAPPPFAPPAYASVPAYAAVPSPAYPIAAAPYPDPPNLHWALVLLIGICTCGLFSIIWDLVQVLWMRKVEPTTKALPYFIGYVICSFANGGLSAAMSATVNASSHDLPRAGWSLLLGLATLVLVILYRFTMKNSLEQHFNTAEPIGLRLGPIMTFFFGGLYFQYHFNRINQIKQAARYGVTRY